MKEIRLYFMVTVFLILPSLLLADAQFEIISVKVIGSRAGDTEKILSIINSKAGDIFDTSVAAADAKRVRLLPGIRRCFFNTIVVEGKIDLIFVIKEKQTVKSITFTGNQKYPDDILKQLLDFKTGDELNVKFAAQKKAAIAKFYRERGFGSVRVKLDREQLSSGTVIYTVYEESVNFTGKADNHIENCDIGIIANSEQWSGWRTGPINFPTYMNPLVPETLEGGPAINFGQACNDLTIILPNFNEGGIHEKALMDVGYWFPGIKTDTTDLTDSLRRKNLILLGTLENNPLSRELLASSSADFMNGIASCGYHIKVLGNPWAKGKKAILALGSDSIGAWQAAIIVRSSIHGKAHTGKLGKLIRWPVDLPEGYFWAPFEAKYTGSVELPEPCADKQIYENTKIPFGVRCWGSPTPTLNTFKRMINTLKQFGINSIVIQPGGWPNLQNSGEVAQKAIDYAYKSGVSVRLYVGNELRSHYPAHLTQGHKSMALAVKDHPGLTAWRLYNQLESDMTAEEYQMVKEQIEWLRSISDKPIGMEVAWGHDTGPMPDDKVKLIDQLLNWGVDEIAHDYAPIGGWSKKHDLSLWEQRIRDINNPFVVLQAHIPFTEPTIPTAAEVRNQYWWCVAGGAKAFFFEAAYVFGHFSNRGLLTWTLEPQPDGRIQEVGKLALVTKNLEEMILNSQPAKGDEGNRIKFSLITDKQQVAVRFRNCPSGAVYLLLINRNLASPLQAEFTIDKTYKLTQLVTDKSTQAISNPRETSCVLSPGGGACYKIERSN